MSNLNVFAAMLMDKLLNCIDNLRAASSLKLSGAKYD